MTHNSTPSMSLDSVFQEFEKGVFTKNMVTYSNTKFIAYMLKEPVKPKVIEMDNTSRPFDDVLRGMFTGTASEQPQSSVMYYNELFGAFQTLKNNIRLSTLQHNGDLRSKISEQNEVIVSLKSELESLREKVKAQEHAISQSATQCITNLIDL